VIENDNRFQLELLTRKGRRALQRMARGEQQVQPILSLLTSNTASSWDTAHVEVISSSSSPAIPTATVAQVVSNNSSQDNNNNSRRTASLSQSTTESTNQANSNNKYRRTALSSQQSLALLLCVVGFHCNRVVVESK